METTEIDLREVVAILKRQSRLILTTLVCAIAIALLYILIATPIYRATTLLLVDSRGTNLLENGPGESQQSAIINSRVDSEAEILRSQATAFAVVQAGDLGNHPQFAPKLGWGEKVSKAMGLEGLDLRRMVGLSPKAAPNKEEYAQKIIAQLQSDITISRQGLTYLIAVTAASDDPNAAAQIANLYADTYIKRQVASKSDGILSSREMLKNQLILAKSQLIEAENAVNGYIDSNLAQIERESGNPAISQLRQRFEAAKTTSQDLQNQILAAEASIASGSWDESIEGLGNIALSQLAKQRKDLESRLAGVTEGSSEAIDLEAALNDLQNQMQAQSQEVFAGLRNDITKQTEVQNSTREELRDLLLQSGLSAEMMTTLFNLQQTATNARTKYQTLLSREQDMATMASLQVADARIVSQALPPASASEPRKQFILLISIVGGLGLGVAFGFMREYYIGGISSANQLANILGARVPVSIGEVEVKDEHDLSDTILTAPMSPYAETFRKLRVSIDMACDAQNFNRGRVILITSALQAEGKSTSAISLARTYAQSGLRCLLIDADMRKPAIANRLGLDPEGGLLEYLSKWGKENGIDVRLQQDPQSDLMVVTAGRRSSTPTDQLLNGPAFRSLMEEAQLQFDVIIIDSPPLLPVVDTRYLARYADAIVQIVRFATTRQSEAREAVAQLNDMKRPDTPVFGALSHEKRSGPLYGRYYNYSYYGEDQA